MTRRECKVCSSPHREFVDGLLDQNEQLRIISARLLLLDPPARIDKNTIWRHSKKCYSLRERAAKRKEEFLRTKADARLHVVWPGDPIPTTSPYDVLVFVEFEELVQRNPRTSDSLAQAPEEIPAAEEAVPEGKKTSLIEKIKSLFHPKANLASTVEAKQPDPPAPETRCSHDWRPIPNGQRCIACGLQKNEFIAIGPSRADYFSRTRRFGRFG